MPSSPHPAGQRPARPASARPVPAGPVPVRPASEAIAGSAGARPRAVTSPKRPYHHGDLRRALLRVAARLIEENGPDALSVREVARRAGVTHAAAAYHF